MLTHKAYGPTADGRYAVAYPVPGCSLLAIVCDCATPAQAEDEAARLNAEQIGREKAIRGERELCGLGGVYADLECLGK